MKIKSPIITLLVGLLIAVVVWTLSVRAHNDKTKPYGAPAAVQVTR